MGRVTPSFRQLYHEQVEDLKRGFQHTLLDISHREAFDLIIKEASNLSKSLDDTQSIVFGILWDRVSAGGLTGMYYFDRGDYIKAREILEKRDARRNGAGKKCVLNTQSLNQ